MADSPQFSTRPSSPLSASVFSSSSALHPRSSEGYRFATLCTTVDNPDADHHDQHGSSSVPIYQTATFKGMGGGYDYTRSGNPSRTFLEHHIAKISSAQHAFAVSSGMGALDIIFRLLKPGDEIIAGNDLYGGSNRLLGYLRTHNGVITHHVDTTKISSLDPYLSSSSNVRMVLLESPTNPLLQIADIEAIASKVHAALPDALVVVDNTMMSPYLMRPLSFGADIVYDSGTKFLSGHHDLMAGVVTCNRSDIAKQLAFVVNSIGNGLAPFDCFLLLRGVKTLAIRFDKQQATAIKVAKYLDALGFKVNYPGLRNHPGREVHERLARGPGAVLSFETGDKALSERIVGAARLWGISVSFGCVNSLISMPCLMSHASIDPAVRAARNLPEDLIRLCVGIEDTDDLIEDLEAALLEAGAVRIVDETGVDSEPRLERPGLARSDGSESTELKKVERDESVPTSLLVSAPGKVILFGEHAVVHGVTAIAGAVDLRCYCLVEPRSDGKVSLTMPDVGPAGSAGETAATWELADLPWERVERGTRTEALPDPEMVALLAARFVKAEKLSAAQAAQAFLYLYMNLTKSRGSARAQAFTFRSALPIGAGLGSSAAFSVCIASALLYTNGHLPLPHSAEPALGSHPDHRGRRAIPEHDAKTVNSWAFVAEKILHGNPSGVDNSVATFGGAIAFNKAMNGKPAVMDGLHGFKSIRFLLTDTKVPRDTKTLVAGVAARKQQDPEYIGSLLSAIQDISDEARRCLTDTDMDREQQVGSLQELVDRNHEQLVALGVGHEALEVIRAKTAAAPFQLHTKLTGAGGGGCAVTIVPDSFSEDSLQDLRSALESNGFACYETTVGGSGFGVHAHSQTDSTGVVEAEGGADATAVPALKRFLETPTRELQRWADGLEGWAFV